MNRAREILLAGAVVVALTIFVTWPQALYLGSRVAVHDDSYFSMWRLAWIAHACRVAGRDLTADEWRDTFADQAPRKTCSGAP